MDIRNDSIESNAVKPIRKRRKDARPSELLKAAITVFARAGFHASSMDEIGAQAGVSKGTVYLYFDKKEQIFAEAVRYGTEVLLERTESTVAEEQGSASKQLRLLVQAWDVLTDGQETRAILKLLLIESSASPFVTRCAGRLWEHMHALVQSLVERGMQQGEFRRCDSAMAAKVILAALFWQGLGRSSIKLIGGEAENKLYAHMNLVLHGLANRNEH